MCDLFRQLYLQDFLVRHSPIYGEDYKTIIGYNCSPTIFLKLDYAVNKTINWIKENNLPLKVVNISFNNFQVIKN